MSPSGPHHVETQNIKGMLWMILAGAVFATMYALIRWLGKEIHVFEMIFFRNLFGLAMLLPFIWRMRHSLGRPKRPGLIVWRGLFQTTSSCLWYYGVTVIALASASALMMLEPIVGSILAIIIFKEKSRLDRWVAVFAGLVGALIIVRPGSVDFSFGAGAVIIAAVLWSGFQLMGKVHSREEPVAVVVAYSSALVVPLSFIPALFFWVTPSLEQIAGLIMLGAVATFGFYCMTSAYKFGDVTVVAPLTFVRLIFAATLGYFMFSEVPDNWIWVGAIIVVTSATYLARLEMKAGKKNA